MPQVCVISINVTDMTMAQQFYCEKLGFEVSKQYDETLVSLKHEGVALLLYKVEESANTVYEKNAQIVIGIETKDIIRTMQEYREKGISFIYDSPKPCPPGCYTAFYDPFGNVIELLEFRY